jgi:hypothetical protein
LKKLNPILGRLRLNKNPRAKALLRRVMLKATLKRMKMRIAAKISVIFRRAGILSFSPIAFVFKKLP